ncbi:hypothetical protein [uncultured Chryseobacterium sp.]|uniref:hypothetical protein n=1 Tax=uncultured Chryseobacterium sp. TaxID=259322 RepID=UPI0025EFB941|nr:hypothetical protein [uncultured Chryseobacterium sp.]
MKKMIPAFLLLIQLQAYAQTTDFLKIGKYRVSRLDEQLKETSGLDLMNGQLYTFNDSGNTPDLYRIDRISGSILRKLPVKAENKDWEALANDGRNFYIGDFGNNAGTRKDLSIYKVPFSEENLNTNAPETIQFYYPEQKEFVPDYGRTDFDAEAMIYLNGKLHVFTKEWGSKATSHYEIDPEISGVQEAQKKESFRTGFMVTDAAYFGQRLYLVGYTKKTEVFLEIFKETQPGVFFSETPQKYYLGSALSIGQIEGIAVDAAGIYISGEKFKVSIGHAAQSLYFIPKEKLKD